MMPPAEAPVAARRPSLRMGRLGLVVLLAGSGSLSVEICASRLLAPYFGDSTVVWANIIGLILIYLSAGYWLGGRIADRHASPTQLAFFILVAAGSIAALPFLAHAVLTIVASGLGAVGAGAVVGSFFTALALFAVPVTLLGMVSPYAIRLALPSVDRAGSVSGRLYALSTIGSILGTFIPALIAIPLVGTLRTMVGTAMVLALAAALLADKRFWLSLLGVSTLFAVPTDAVKPTAGLLFETESQYQYMQITQDGRARALTFNEGIGAQSVWWQGSDYTGGPWDMFALTPALTAHPVHHVLILGNAGGTIARMIAHEVAGVTIDGVEIDPAVTDAGRRYLGMADIPGLKTITADGREYLRASDAQYDLIFVDAYNATYVPFYLTTQEFFQLVRQHLSPHGLVALNIATIPGHSELPDAVGGTMAAEFPSVWGWRPLQLNELVIGFPDPTPRATLLQRLQGLAAPLDLLRPLFSAQVYSIPAAAAPLTDDQAPIEWITDAMIVQRILAGSVPSEQPLPTHP